METNNRKRNSDGCTSSNDQERISSTRPNNKSDSEQILYMIKLLSKAIEKKPNDAELLRLQSDNYLKLASSNDRLRKELDDALKALANGPTYNVSFRTHLANVYMALADSDKAQDVLAAENLPQEIQTDQIKMSEVNQALRQIRLKVLTEEYGMRKSDAEKLLHLHTIDAIKTLASRKTDPNIARNPNQPTPITTHQVQIKEEKDLSDRIYTDNQAGPPKKRRTTTNSAEGPRFSDSEDEDQPDRQRSELSYKHSENLPSAIKEENSNDTHTTEVNSLRLSNSQIQKLIKSREMSCEKSVKFHIFIEELQRYASDDGYFKWIEAYYKRPEKDSAGNRKCPFNCTDNQTIPSTNLDEFEAHFASCKLRSKYPLQTTKMYCDEFPPEKCPAIQVNGFVVYGCCHEFVLPAIPTMRVSPVRTSVNYIWIGELKIFTSYPGLIEYVIKTMSWSAAERSYACISCKQSRQNISWDNAWFHFQICHDDVSAHCLYQSRCKSLMADLFSQMHECPFLDQNQPPRDRDSIEECRFNRREPNFDTESKLAPADYMTCKYPASLSKLLASKTSTDSTSAAAAGRTYWVAELGGYVDEPTLRQYVAGYHAFNNDMKCPARGCSFEYMSITLFIEHFLYCRHRGSIQQMGIRLDENLQ